MGSKRMQIGEVADRIGLSLRTIRHYEEVGLVTPTARSQGGFRLYTDGDVARLQVIKRMKPLGFSLEQMRELLTVLDELQADDLPESRRAQLAERIDVYRALVERHCAELRARLADAEQFSAELVDRLED